jgi:hypothetical protein
VTTAEADARRLLRHAADEISAIPSDAPRDLAIVAACGQSALHRPYRRATSPLRRTSCPLRQRRGWHSLSRGCATLVLRRRQCCSSCNPGVSLATRGRLLSARCREEASVCEMLAGGRMRVCAPARYSAKGPRLSRCPEASGSRSYPGPASNVKVVPTAHCTNASGMARAIAWTALQPEQCAGRTRPTPAARSASTVGWMRASNSPPVR